MSSIFTLTSPDKCDDYREDSFYPTPWDATEAFMLAEEKYLSEFKRIDEPACGEGDMAEVIRGHGHYLGYEYIGMILKANYWNTSGRIPLFREFKPVRIYPYSWRIDFTGGGSNHFDCIYVAWMPNQSYGICEFCDPLERPKVLSQPSLF